MRLKTINIRHFKRFTNLSVKEIPREARLIVLAGPNGSGKSSFFDALHVWHEQHSNRGVSWQDDYHRKLAPQSPPSFQGNEIHIDFHHAPPANVDALKKMFYIRSAYRNEADFTVNTIGRTNRPLDVFPVNRMIDDDRSVSKNYQRLVSEGMVDLYGRAPGSTTFDEYRDLVVHRIGTALVRVLPDLHFDTLANPFDDGTFRFTKGVSERFHYKNLSGGEKGAFDLLSDLVMALRDYDDTVYCIDEPESHLNTKLQGDLLSAMFELLPESCQLVVATHSIGMMRRAQDLAETTDGEVVFFDFGGRNFDESVDMVPAVHSRAFWSKQYEVALGDLAALVAPRRVVICEGEPEITESGGNLAFDSQCYETIFEDHYPDTRFISMGNDRQIIGDQRGLAEALLALVEGIEVGRLIDRDSRTDTEVALAQADGISVLSRRSIESYLLDDEVLATLCVTLNQSDRTQDLLAEKQRIIGTNFDPRTGKMKRHAGELFEACKRILQLEAGGTNRYAFMRDVLAPLIRSEMTVYKELERDIFG